jgi:hypothetical protein
MPSATRRPARTPERRARLHPALASLVTLALALPAGLACTQRALVGRDEALARDGSLTYDTAPFDGTGFVDGRLHGHAVFDYVNSIYWFGGDNDPSRLELWIFQDTATCEELSKPGWITKVRPTDLMGITVGGSKPGIYYVAAEKPPAPGNAYLHHVIDQTDPVEESYGQSGSVTITSVKPGVGVSGAFEATFQTGTLQGPFNAVWCPTGVGL